jgi:hypothetical protein
VVCSRSCESSKDVKRDASNDNGIRCRGIGGECQVSLCCERSFHLLLHHHESGVYVLAQVCDLATLGKVRYGWGLRCE